MTAFLFLVVLTVFVSVSRAQTVITDDMRSFSHAQKEGRCVPDEEVVLFERHGAPGVVTEQWFTGQDCFVNDSVIRYYIDGDRVPTIEGELFMMHGIGFYDAAAAKPWGSKWLGHVAKDGGLYNTFRVPYSESIRITVQVPNRTFTQNRMFWFILRGVENFPVVVGDVVLPPTARLRLQKIKQKSFEVYEYVQLASSQKNGLLFMVTLAGESTDFNYLEGCFRICTRNNTDVQYLSSGTEDFFMSAYYYNKGLYHTEHAGLTYFKNPGTMSAYKIFSSDPVLFKDSFHLVWRQSEKNDNECYTRVGSEKCQVSRDGHVTLTSQREKISPERPMFATTEISSYVWFYEW